MIKMQIEGLQEVLSVLKDMPEAVSHKALTQGMRVAGREMRRTARDLAPKNTGKLRRNIKLVTLKRRSGRPAAVFIGFTKGASKKLLGELSEKKQKSKFPWYFIPQEFGWTDKKGKRHTEHGYLRRALARHKSTLVEAVGEATKKVIAEFEAKAKQNERKK